MKLTPTFRPPSTALGTERQSQHDRVALLLAFMKTDDSHSLDFVHSFEPRDTLTSANKRSHPHDSVDLTVEDIPDELLPSKKKKQSATPNSLGLSLFDGEVSWHDKSKHTEDNKSQYSISSSFPSLSRADPKPQLPGISAETVSQPARPQISQPNNSSQHMASQGKPLSGASDFSILRSFTAGMSTTASSRNSTSRLAIPASSASVTNQSNKSTAVVPKSQNSFLKLAAVLEKPTAATAASGSTSKSRSAVSQPAEHPATSTLSASAGISSIPPAEKAKKGASSNEIAVRPSRLPATHLTAPRGFDVTDLLGLDRVCRNAAATIQGFELFQAKMLQSSILAVGIVFRDLTTNHAVTSVKFCTPSTRCSLWHCTCERVIRGELLRESHILTAILVAQPTNQPARDPAVYFLPLARCVEPSEGHGKRSADSDVVLPIHCEVDLTTRWQAMQAILQSPSSVKMVYHVQVACLPLHRHLRNTSSLPSLFDPRLVAYLQNPDVADAQLELHALLGDAAIGMGDMAGLGKLGRLVDKTARELK
eukprot:gene29623-35759_t